jgi:acetyl-CoA carboxylase biotin carboxyl carrier protein
MSMDYEKIRQLVKLVEKNRLAELTIEEEELSVTIKTETSTPAVHAPAGGPVETPSFVIAEEMVHEEAELEEISSEQLFEILSPMVGVFYRCPSPDSPPFVEAGDHVELGQAIGLIEAMKVFSEVPAEVAGRVIYMAVENAGLVQQGDVLAVIDTSDVHESTV